MFTNLPQLSLLNLLCTLFIRRVYEVPRAPIVLSVYLFENKKFVDSERRKTSHALKTVANMNADITLMTICEVQLKWEFRSRKAARRAIYDLNSDRNMVDAGF